MPAGPAPIPDTRGDAPMPSSFDSDLDFWDEGRLSKFTRRLKEEPLIPVGLALTCYALFGAARSIRKGNKIQTNAYFRARVYAQGFTILCLCVGSVYWKEDRQKRKYYQGLLGEKRAQEKRDLWIKELEARDKEDQVEREKKVRRREARKLKAEEDKAMAKEMESNSAMSSEDLHGLFFASPLLARAMQMWRSSDK